MTALAVAQAGPNTAVPANQEPRPELKTVVKRLEQAALDNRDRYRAYVITREFRMYGRGEAKPASTVMADVSFIPPKTKEFTITGTQGSSRGETIVRHILESEQKAAETGQAPGAISSDNYDFRFEGDQKLDGHDCFVLGLTPKHKEKNLVAGRAWVDKNTYLVRRVQGQMAKMPTWWFKSVDVTLDFSEVDGMWLKTHTSATADVRVFGPHTLQDDAIKVRTGNAVANVSASRAKAARQRTRRPDAVLGTFQR